MAALDLPAPAAALERASPAPRPPAPTGSAAAAARAGREFEAMFLTQMLSPMFDALPVDGPFGGGFGERMFRSLQVDAFARGLAERGGIGLASRIARELLLAQERPHG